MTAEITTVAAARLIAAEMFNHAGSMVAGVSFVVALDADTVAEVWFTRQGTAHLQNPNA
jgi:hypothetical protein